MLAHAAMNLRLLAAVTLLAACGTGAVDPDTGVTLDPTDSSEGAATAATPRCEMFAEQACLLSTASSSSKRVFEVHYPNLSFCSVRLIPTRNAADLTALARELEVTLSDEGKTVAVPIVVRQNALELGVGSRDLYIVDLTLRTKSGRSLTRVLQEKLGSQLIAVPRHCPGRE